MENQIINYGVSKFDSNSHFQRVTNVVEAEVDGHMVVMSIDTGLYLEIGGAGKKIWEILKDERTLVQIVDRLVENYTVEIGLCRQQTSDYLEKLLAQRLVELRSTSGAE